MGAVKDILIENEELKRELAEKNEALHNLKVAYNIEKSEVVRLRKEL